MYLTGKNIWKVQGNSAGEEEIFYSSKESNLYLAEIIVTFMKLFLL